MYIYKYRSLNEKTGSRIHTLDILKNSRLYLSRPSEFNDPFDCQLPLDLSGSDENEDMKKILADLEKKIGKAATTKIHTLAMQKGTKENAFVYSMARENMFEKGLNRVGITSFSGEKKHLSILMWAHYADNHYGVCFVFNNEPPIGNYLEPVRYVPTPPKTRVFDLTEEEVKKALTSKSDIWRYEDEYRLLIPDNANKVIKFLPASLVGVQFGLRTKEEDKKEILRILKEVRYPGLRVYQMTKSDENFDLVENFVEEVNNY